MSMLYHFLKKSIDFQESFLKSYLFDKKMKAVYKKSILKECIRIYFLHWNIFCFGIYISVSKPYVFENGLFQLSGGTSCLLAIWIWQAIERVHFVYSSWFSWRHESSLRFGIAGAIFFTRVAAMHDLKVFFETGYNGVVWNVVENMK